MATKTKNKSPERFSLDERKPENAAKVRIETEHGWITGTCTYLNGVFVYDGIGAVLNGVLRWRYALEET